VKQFINTTMKEVGRAEILALPIFYLWPLV